MNHSFNVEIAVKVGVDKAILLENIMFWINRNIANKQHEHDGETWTYNSTNAFAELFPYFSANKIQKLLRQLEVDGYIKTGNYNTSPYDRTKWYTIANEWVKSLYPTIKPNGRIKKTDKPITFGHLADCNNTDINTDINTDNTPLNPPKGKVSKKKEFENYLVEKIKDTSFVEYQDSLISFIGYRMSLPAKDRYKTKSGINGLLTCVGDLIRAGMDPVGCIKKTMEEEWLKPKPKYFMENGSKWPARADRSNQNKQACASFIEKMMQREDYEEQ